jgi:hypothetical protein
VIRKVAAGVVLLCVGACRSTGAPPTYSLAGRPSPSKAEATLEVASLTPPLDTLLGRTSVLVAEIRFEIRGYDDEARYYLVPLFEKRGGQGTFNQLPGFESGVRITAPTGNLRLEYAIHAEWDSQRLNHPVRVFFAILEMTGLHHASSIGISDEFVYSRSPPPSGKPLGGATAVPAQTMASAIGRLTPPTNTP